MKKLIIAIGAVMLGIVANAATYNWSASAGWVTSTDSDDSSTFDGNTVYLFDANAYAKATFLADIANTTVGSKALENSLGSGVIGDGAFDFSGTGLTDNGATPPYASAYAVILASSEGKDYAYVIDFDSVKVTDAVIAGGANFSMGENDVYTGAVGGAGWTAVAVPEPTSGLLLLLGVAGLALKRKRA